MLRKGTTEDLKFFGCPDYKTKGIAWKSSNDAVATVDKNGVVTAVAAGAAQITYEASGYTCEPVTVVVADEYNVFIAKQDGSEAVASYTINLKDDPADFRFVGAKGWTSSRNSGYWTSTDEAVAKVDKNGVVTPVGKGDCYIALTILDKATGKVAYAVQPMHLTVKAEDLEVKQISYNSARVKFNGKPVDADNLEVYIVGWDANKEEQLIKEYVIVDAENVTFYNGIVNGQRYAFFVKGKEEPVYITGNVGDCADFEVRWTSKLFGNGTSANVAYADQDVNFTLMNFRDANNVIINASGYSWEYIDTCTVDGVETVTQYYENDALYIPANSHHKVEFIAYNAENVKACTKTVEFDAADPKAWSIESAEWAIGSLYYLDTTLGPSVYRRERFDECKQLTKLSIDDDDRYGISLRITDTFGNKFVADAGDCNNAFIRVADDKVVGDVSKELYEYGQITFESSNPNVVAVKDDGTLEIIKENGSATIFCYFQALENGDAKLAPRKLLFATTINTIGHLKPTDVKMTVNGEETKVVYINESWGTAEVEFTVKDQLGRPMKGVQVRFKAYDQNKSGQLIKFMGLNYVDSLDKRFRIYYVGSGLRLSSDYEWAIFDDDTDSDGKTDYTFTGQDFPAVEGGLAYKGILNTRIDFEIVGDNGTAKKSLNIGEFDTSNMTPDPEPGIIWYHGNDGDWDHRLPVNEEIGLTSSMSGSRSIWVKARAVDVYTASGAKVYGGDYCRDGFYPEFYTDANIAKKSSSSDLAAYAGKTYIQIEGTNLPTDADGNYITAKAGSNYCIMVRKSYDDLYDGVMPGGYNSEQSDAIALSKIKEVTIDVKVWQVLNTNSLDPAHPTYNKRLISKNDFAEKRTLRNKDAQKYDTKFTLNTLYYIGDSPTTQAQWKEWVMKHSTLAISWNNWERKPLSDKRVNVPIDSTVVDLSTGVIDKVFVDVRENSKYIRKIEFFFYNEVGVPSRLIYIPFEIGKTIRPWTYEYKYETFGVGDSEGR